MGEFSEATSWMKGAMVLAVLALGLHCFATATPGWSSYSLACPLTECSDRQQAIQALQIIAFILIVTACVMVICEVLLDELRGNKLFYIAFIVIIFVSGACATAGIGVYGAEQKRTEVYSLVITVLAAAAAFGSGLCGLLELCNI